MNTKAVRLHGKNDLRLDEITLPEVGPDDVQVKIICDSVCMSTYKAALEGEEHKRVPDNVAENPTIMENFIRSLGADAVVYGRRNECCGGYISVESPDAAKRNSNAIIQNAKAAGAEMIVTACPLCKYNLEKNGADIPVVYFTELLAEALGVKEDTDGKQ